MILSLMMTAITAISAQTKNYKISAQPIGPSEHESRALEKEILNHHKVRRYLQGKNFRLIASELSDGIRLNSLYSLYVYNYTDNIMYHVEGPVDFRESPTVQTVLEDMAASPQEYLDATKILRAHQNFRNEFKSKNLFVYEPMPSILTDQEGFQGFAKPRIVLVGLNSKTHPEMNQIVGVNLANKRITKFVNHAPANSLATRRVCGPSSAGQASTGKGIAGSAVIEIKRDEQVIWKFIVVRPSASSGAKGSGLEIRQVYYKEQLVLNRAHTPIINVEYANNRCGPYRDWGYAENPFRAVGTNLAPGIRMTNQRPTTIVDSGSDQGNFRGVAIYQDDDKVLLVTEISAGWYRYVSQFEFYDDGTIKPTFNFSSVANSCVCYSHNHHVYWRFDFDVNGQANSVLLKNGDTFTPVEREISQKRRSGEVWRVLDESGMKGYELQAGVSDGVADSFAVADIWMLRYRTNEIDDSAVRRSARAALNSFLTGESLVNSNLIMWYGAHFFHSNDDGIYDHATSVGPTMRFFELNQDDEVIENPGRPERPNTSP